MTNPQQLRAWTSQKVLLAIRGAMTLALALATLVLQSPSAQAQTYTVIHAFTGGTDGQYPYAGLTLDSAGNQYGVTQGGGTFGYGTVFEFNTSGQESVLFNFRAPLRREEIPTVFCSGTRRALSTGRRCTAASCSPPEQFSPSVRPAEQDNGGTFRVNPLLE